MNRVDLAGSDAFRYSPSPASAEVILVDDRTLVEASGLFDPGFYLDRYSDVTGRADEALDHFLQHGGQEGRHPSAWFHSRYYLARNPLVKRARINPLVHYLRVGHLDGRAPNPFFDTDWYRSRHPEIGRSDPLIHYIRYGSKVLESPHPMFDADFYLTSHHDVAASRSEPLAHYLAVGHSEGRPGFDVASAGRGARIAVAAHVFYEDVWPEIDGRLDSIAVDFDLFVTIPIGSPALRASILESRPEAQVFEVTNAGRDLGGFLAVLPKLLDGGYDAVCKIHSKKGATEPATWRYLHYEGLLGSQIFVSNVLRAFSEDPSLGVVGPADFYLDGPMFITKNGPLLKQIASELYPEAVIPREWGFFAGTMFWFRPALLKRWRGNDFQARLEVENTSSDAQLAHALERMLGLAVAMEGMRIGLSDVTGERVASGVDIERAPHFTSTFQPAQFLPVRTAQLSETVPLVKKGRRLTWLAPKGARPGVTLIGPVGAVNGLGVSARGYADALLETGLPLNVMEWKLGFERVKMQAHAYPSREEQPINLVHVNLDLMHDANLLDSLPLNRLMPGRFNIAAFYWELLSIKPEWVNVINRFDELWVASKFMKRAIEAITPVPVRVIRPAISAAPTVSSYDRASLNLPADPFIFFYNADAGSVIRRKNPQALWRAYDDAFTPEQGACLVIKLNYADPGDPALQELIALSRRRPDVVFMTELLTEEEMVGLFANIDCYVSPHRSEGLGLTVVEAMRAGKPVVATRLGGVSDFVTPDTAYVVDHDLVEVGEGAEPYPSTFVWGEPRPDSLREAMLAVFSDRERAAQVGAKGQAKVAELFSVSNVASIIDDEIRNIWTRSGGTFASTPVGPAAARPTSPTKKIAAK
ncbi:rhamnan synthesis F family protein [Brevundimonas sp. TWP2-3-4b1]|uniref:rhamnan synthesis F family protein n=1 Tax=Brevundimonas sp. TWP2-3-4b1 TaxID=2804580 RepID=UPI003CF8B8AF